MSAPARYDDAFFDSEERLLGERFLADGHLILPAEDRGALDRIRQRVVALAAGRLGVEAGDPDRFLNDVHELIEAPRLNDVRLAVIEGLNAEPWLRPCYYRLAKRALTAVVGNELAMQRRLNLSIQLPGDESSVLPVHADSWDGDSPFEVVLWVPLVDCRATKSMFLLPGDKGRAVEAGFRRFDGRSTEDLFRAIEPDLVWLDVPYGSILLFSQNLMHGNRVNREAETRWSMNCRFKSLLSPYSGKRLGEFFEPVTLRPATRIGMEYRFPEGFDE
jgi:sporadic carbohydrate cluster 2OG-Fe(II) oxygenase